MSAVVTGCRVEAPAAAVFAAFTEADLVARWFSPAEEIATEVRVHHERFPDRSIRDRHDDGWQTTLARLPGVLATDSRPRRE